MLAVVVLGIIVISVQTKAENTGNNSRIDITGGESYLSNNDNLFQDNVENEDNGQLSMKNSTSSGDVVEKWQEGVVTHNGKNYIYNSNLKTYLLMGIDNNDPVETAKDSVSGGQSDALFLLVADNESQKLTVVSINRNTMTDVDVYDRDGSKIGTWMSQICVQHGFGDGKKLSCSRTVDAVSKLFNNIPISGYVSINMGAIPALNDSVGGVEVKVIQDLKYPENGVDLNKGDVVTLNGDEAYCYLRGRDINDFDSATDRLRREEQYVVCYMDKLRSESGGKTAKAIDVYGAIADYLVTNVDFTQIVSQLIDYDFSEERVYTVPGITKMGEKFEEYYVAENDFSDLIFNVFYREVK